MTGKDTRFGEFLFGEVEKIQGVYMPVKAGLFRTLFVRNARIKHVHPNPNDEFCMPKVGPNYEIISNYVHKFQEARRHSRTYCDDPVVVQKIRPSGYMLLNGHHRWGAAIRLNYKRIPIKIVNLTTETDIDKMLQKSRHDRRVTLDLDEVVFRKEADALCEKPLGFPFRKMYKERLRLGIPALFHFFARSGYDIWVYSANYYSMGYIRALFKKYRVNVSGIVTGTARKDKADPEARQRVEKRIATKYSHTLHIDNGMLLRISGKDGKFEEHPLCADSPEWSREIMRLVKEMQANEH